MPKQQLKELASQLGLSADGKLDDLRVRVKENWIAVDAHLPKVQHGSISPLGGRTHCSWTFNNVYDSGGWGSF
jgi:hypothetical protein